MNRFLCVVILTLCLSTPTQAQFYSETIDEYGVLLDLMFIVALASPECSATFAEMTGHDPLDVYQFQDITLIVPDSWPVPGAAALTVCKTGMSGPRISINLPYLYTVGPMIGAHIMIHELAHAAMCDRKLKLRREERMACRAAEACMPLGTNCDKYAAGFSHLWHPKLTFGEHQTE